MSNFYLDELMDSLQAHEARLNRSAEKLEEKTFQVKGEASNSSEFDKTVAGGRGAKNCDRGRSKGFK